MKIEQITLMDAAIYGYQQGEDAARSRGLNEAKDLRLTIRDQSIKIEELKAERENLVRMLDELTTNEWGRIKSVLETVSNKLKYTPSEVNALSQALTEVQEREKRVATEL